MSELIASLRKMSINGNRLELPSEQLANYADVKKALQKAGGKYVKCSPRTHRRSLTVCVVVRR